MLTTVWGRRRRRADGSSKGFSYCLNSLPKRALSNQLTAQSLFVARIIQPIARHQRGLSLFVPPQASH
jgi:hypothetical protein